MDVLAVSDLGLTLVGGGAALLGAIVGGGITGWLSLRAEDKRQTFARELEDRRAADLELKEKRAEQAAGRLVLEELMKCGAALVAARANPDDAPHPEHVLPMSAWSSESPRLAAAMPFDLWLDLALVYGTISSVRIEHLSSGTWPRPETLGEHAVSVDIARADLTEHLGKLQARWPID